MKYRYWFANLTVWNQHYPEVSDLNGVGKSGALLNQNKNSFKGLSGSLFTILIRHIFIKQIISNISVLQPNCALVTKKYNIFHCSSNLYQNKFLSHLSDSSRCPCGDDVEDNFHYFYVCPLFICQIILPCTHLRDLAEFLNIDVLLKGFPYLSFDDNVLIMNSVHTFICGTKRLDY